MSPSVLESGQLDEQIVKNLQKRSKSKEAVGRGDAISPGRKVFNATINPNKSQDIGTGIIQVKENSEQTGIPEQDDEILRQLNQMT